MKSSFNRTFVTWPLRLIAISLAVGLGTFCLVPLSKLFVAAAVVFGSLHSLSTLEELTGGRELTWLTLPLVLAGDGFLTSWAFAGMTFMQSVILFLQFLAVVVLTESVIVFRLRSQLQAFCMRRDTVKFHAMSNKRLERTRR